MEPASDVAIAKACALLSPGGRTNPRRERVVTPAASTSLGALRGPNPYFKRINRFLAIHFATKFEKAARSKTPVKNDSRRLHFLIRGFCPRTLTRSFR
jgi:hypothetical protein